MMKKKQKKKEKKKREKTHFRENNGNGFASLCLSTSLKKETFTTPRSMLLL